MDPDEALKKLTEHFCYVEERVHLMEPVYKQQAGEKVSDYMFEVDNEIRTRYPPNCPARKDTESLRLSLFVSGLLGYIRERLLMGNPQTHEEAYKLAQRWEHIAFMTAKVTGSSRLVMFADPNGPSVIKTVKQPTANVKLPGIVAPTNTVNRPSYPPPRAKTAAQMKDWAYEKPAV